ncbi:bifunctional RNase H/acid phosphatase [Flindersiella endophytica]
MTQLIYIEADGGSRGNPGPAAYGALLRDAGTGKVLAEAAESVGIATNNVAEYNGLIAGLRLFQEFTPDAGLEVRMDSKLVVEQMAGRWKIKHPDMRPLALEARRLAPPNVQWTWVPREQNKAADALLNKVLDGGPAVWRWVGDSSPKADPAGGAAEGELDFGPEFGAAARAGTGAGTGAAAGAETGAETGTETGTAAKRGWGETIGTPTTLVLLRHGETPMSQAKRFSGSGGSDPAMTPLGQQQVKNAAALLANRGGIDVVVSSPLLRTRESAAMVAEVLGLTFEIEPGLAETDFGQWDGLTFAEVRDRWPAELNAWLTSTAVAPPGGESFDAVLARVRQARDKILRTYGGQTVLAVTHVSPIKLLASLALDVSTPTIFRMELMPASITELRWYSDGAASLHTFGATAM